MSDNDTHTGFASDTGTRTDTSGHADTGPDTDTPGPVRESDRALFRAHAAARLRGDTAEALRLAFQIGEEKRMAQLLYVLYLFTQTVYDEFGDTPDPWDLAEVTRRLHERHYRPGSGFWPIRAEAMVRGVCGDSVLLTEVPVAEQPTYMWAVINELIDPEITDAQIAEALDRAETLGAEIVRAGWDSMFTDLPAPRSAPKLGSASKAAPDSDPWPEEGPMTGPESAASDADPVPEGPETAPGPGGRREPAANDTPSGDSNGDRTDIQADEETTA